MPCCVPKCATDKPLVRFPKDARQRSRWQRMVQMGTGVNLAANDDQQRHEICAGHFANPGKLDRYQEPVLYTGRSGKPLKLASCRLCQRIYNEIRMFKLDLRLAGKWLKTVVYNTLKIRMNPEEISKMLCHECLVMVDLVYRIQTKYSEQEKEYQNFLMLTGPLELVESMEEVNFGEKDISAGDEEFTEEVLYEEIISTDEVIEAPLTRTSELLNSAEDDELQVVWRAVTPEEEDEAEWPLEEDTEPPVPEGPPKRKYKTKPKKPKRQVSLTITSAKTCYMCKKLFPSREELMIHLLENHATPEGYACAECNNKPFETVVLYNTHLRYHDASEREYKCNFCAMRFGYKYSRTNHETLEHGANHKLRIRNKRAKPAHQCELCGKLLFTAYLLDRHMQTHKGSVKCKICAKTLTSTSHLNVHLMHHVNHRPFRCTVCNRRYASKHSLKQHIVPCAICHGSFHSRTEHRQHIKDEHPSENHRRAQFRFRCQLCPAVPRLKADLVAHIEDCHGDEDYPYESCELCPGSTFVNLQALRMHDSTQHREREMKRGRRRVLEEANRCEESEEG